MTGFSQFFISLSSWLTLLSDVVIVILTITLFSNSPTLVRLRTFIGGRAILISFLISLGAFIGSLIFSNIIGFEPCVLCWVQRIFIYPQVIMFGVALWKKDLSVFLYALPLSIIGGVVALYQSYTNFGGAGFTACTAMGSVCSKIYFMSFGFVTIPTMSLTAFLLLILVACIKLRQQKI